MNEVYAFKVYPSAIPEWATVINARSLGKAKAEYWRSIKEYWDVPFTAIRGKRISMRALSSEQFIANAEYRGMPAVRCGQRVRVGKGRGVIIGHNASANFDVLFDDDSPKYPGLTLNVHPGEIELEQSRSGSERGI